jgi:hypothetical protein
MYNPYDSLSRPVYELTIRSKLGQSLKAHYDLQLSMPSSLLALLMQLNEGPEEEPGGESGGALAGASDDRLM